MYSLTYHIHLQPENRNTINTHNISQHGSHSQILIQCTPTKVFFDEQHWWNGSHLYKIHCKGGNSIIPKAHPTTWSSWNLMQLQNQANRIRKCELRVQSHLLFYLLWHSVVKITVMLQTNKKVYKKSDSLASCDKANVTNTVVIF